MKKISQALVLIIRAASALLFVAFGHSQLCGNCNPGSEKRNEIVTIAGSNHLYSNLFFIMQ